MAFINADALRTSAEGHWRDILACAGIPASILDGRGHPCPKCGGRDRFAAFHGLDARGAVHCRNCFTAGSPLRPGDGIQTLRWWLGCSFHDALTFVTDVLGHHGTTGWAPTMSVKPAARPGPSPAEIRGHEQYARSCHERLDESTRSELAARLGVPARALRSLNVGVTSDGNASTWPMTNGDGTVIGVRLSTVPWHSGEPKKWSRPGSRNGLFLSREKPVDRSRLWVTEGASDTAAAIGLGVWALGRASCGSSHNEVCRYVERQQPRSVTVVADNDAPGLEGATRLARAIASSGAVVTVIAPPNDASDLREWTRNGAVAQDLRDHSPIEVCRRPAQLTFDFVSQPMLTT